MERGESHRHLRQCFLPPIPEIDLATDLIGRAADALLLGDELSTRSLLLQADITAIHRFAQSIMGKTEPSIHRYPPSLVRAARPARAPARMPPKAVAAKIFVRDGYRCRFCGCRIILPDARSVLIERIPGAIRWGSSNRDKHAAFFSISASIDHIIPHARGGDNEVENLVTTCQPCNFGRNNWLLEEVELIDPRCRLPIVDNWDGLTRLLKLRAR